MKLSKLYCSYPNIFETIEFNSQLNIILAEVRLPGNKQKSSHSLGKSTLVAVIDFCLLKGINKHHFFKKNYYLFEEFSFFLEVELDDGRYCTIKRSVKEKSKIFIRSHKESKQDFTYFKNEQWDIGGGIDKAKTYFNTLLDFNVPLSLKYRQTISYFLRDPDSFKDVFRLSKFTNSRDIVWKPIVAQLLGFDSSKLVKKYELDVEINQLEDDHSKTIRNQYEINQQEERYKTILSLKEEELNTKEQSYDSFSFKLADIDTPKALVNDIDKHLTVLVQENYYLKSHIENSKQSIVDYNIDLDKIENFYKEIGLYFTTQIKKEYGELVQFNEEILSERNGILTELINEYSDKYNKNCQNIILLNEKRSLALQYISTSESFEKFKLLQSEVIEIKTQVEVLKNQIESLKRKYDNSEIREQKVKEVSEVIKGIKQEFWESDNPYIDNIKKQFTSIILEVLGDVGVIGIFLNNNNNIDFIPEIIDMDTKKSNSKDKGTTYRKLMCCAFDLALLATYSGKNFFHFVYHDGIFDGLDDRQKENYFNLLNNYCQEYNIQYIFTSIQDELPPLIRNRDSIAKLIVKKIIVKLLHDEDKDGKLFKMSSF